MALIAPEFSDQAARHEVPGVEVVLVPTDEQAKLLTPFALKLIGALQRRTYGRVQSMMQRRALGTAQPAQPFTTIDLSDSAVVADFGSALSWQGRLDELERAAKELGEGELSGNVVRVRGWDRVEPGVLVDGRPVLAAVFDVAMVFAICLDRLREGEVPFDLVLPMPNDADASRLWSELIRIAEGRSGVDLGSVRYTS